MSYEPHDPLPPITRDSDDELCREAMRRDPALLTRVQQAASAAYRAARALPVVGLAPAVDRMWTALAASVRAAHGQPACLRLSLAAGQAMEAITRLPPAERAALADQPNVGGFYTVPARRAAMQSHPALAAVLAAEDAEAARITASQEAIRAQQAAAHEAARPGVLLKALRERGIDLELDRGRLTVSAAAVLSQAEREEAAAVKAGLVEILTAEAAAKAEAARRTVLA